MKSIITKALTLGAMFATVLSTCPQPARADHWDNDDHRWRNHHQQDSSWRNNRWRGGNWRSWNRPSGRYYTYYALPTGTDVRFHRGRGNGFWYNGTWYDAYNDNGRWGTRVRMY